MGSPMRRAFAIGLSLVLGCAAGRTTVTARDLIEAPAPHDGAHIVLVGQVQDLRSRTPTTGNSYTAFVLADGTGHVPVVGWGTQRIDLGDLVEVRGVFHTTMRAGTDTLLDTVEADFVRRLRAAAQPPGTPVGPP
jgi:hypothetical protein